MITKPRTALRPSQCRVWMQRTLAENFPEILERFLDDATPKSLSHMRMVTELLEADVKKVKRKRSSFQRMLQDFAVDEKVGNARGLSARREIQ